MNLPPELYFKQFSLGPMGNFQYFIGDKKAKEVAIVDPNWDIDYICKLAERENLKIVAAFLTHGHYDHADGVFEIISRFKIKAYISRNEADIYRPKHKDIIEIDDGAKIKIGNIEFEFIWTPGHTPGCQCIRYKNVLLTGDVLFVDACGRCDLPGSDPKAMYNSLYNVLMKLSDDTLIFSGHGYGEHDYDTLGNQKKTNYYLTCKSLNEFLHLI